MPRKLYLAVVLLVASIGAIRAQTGEWTPPHRMLLTPERALAMLIASDRRLEYVPGEVLVQFVVDTTGFNGHGSLDAMGHFHSDAMRATERFHRRDFGHMEAEITIVPGSGCELTIPAVTP